MRFGVVLLPEFRWSAARSLWRRVEELGFDHAWTYDHLAWRSMRDETWFGAVPFLTAGAVVTDRIRLGTLVASPNFRHPVPFARELVTLDDISGGRLTLGIGAGGHGWDAVMLGQDPWSASERAERFAEFVEVLDRMLREPEVSFDGRFYVAVDARTYPGCVQAPRIPFAVAATGGRGMHLAASYGSTWVTTGDLGPEGSLLGVDEGVKVVRAQMDRLDESCVAIGRDPRSVDRLVLTGPRLDAGLTSLDAFDEVAGRYAEAGVTDLVVHWPRPAAPYRGDGEIFERIFAEVCSRRTPR
ncbi:MAG TPA: LLM class flavin-dependent oxidoreductase [Acidimicrobiales bacterium]|nr:LLM class flavin-dependent oxidoreductase [Acidimicrobiales bacterium]